MSRVYEIYKTSPRTGNKTMLDSVNATSAKGALKKYLSNKRTIKGKYLVLPHKVRSKYTFIKR